MSQTASVNTGKGGLLIIFGGFIMIIWINGAFGAGKTQTAYELHRRLADSFVYDPENVGYFIRKNIPKSLSMGDFQDYPMWRSFSRDMLNYIAANYMGDTIVPMTITNRVYYDEIIGVLSKTYKIRHVILYASKEELLKRLASRLESRNSWAAQQIDRCIKAFDEDITEVKIHTDNKDICQIVETISELVGVPLLADKRSNLRKKLDRFVIQCKHIR